MTITNQPRHLQKMWWTKLDVPTNYWYLMATCPIEFAFAWAYILAHMVNAKKLENWSVPWTIVKWVLRGVYDRGIKELASLSSQDLHGRNASPNLYRFIHKKNRTLPIAISAVKIPVKVRKPSQVISKQWPVLHLSSWLRTCMTDPNYGGFFVLGGKTLDQLDAVRDMFSRFWQRYSYVDGCLAPESPGTTIPIFIHGDEGRGQCKRPLMIISFQVVIPWAGEDVVNNSKILWFEFSAIAGLDWTV